ncbi:MAG TPA: thioredoxin domain-containing protein [Candidatus Nanoarchaeia archaeon]|nr:thioredoxin domain-containing protein [Candidatus Nanoarchaeia archaeon]
MEQKQLDEIENDSYFGEEFVEEDLPEDKDEDFLEEKGKSKKAERKEKEVKKTAMKKTKSAKKNDYPVYNSKTESKVEKPAVKEEIKITPAHEPKVVETSSPVNPWADDDESSGEGMFTKVSTWKVIAGILLVLVIFSIYTEGFGVQNSNGTELTLSEAEDKALTYVNNNLLQAPFVATVEKSAAVGDLYKITLAVAGQSVDSYLTKDGNLFFPQGFDLSASALTGTTGGAVELKEVSIDDDAVKGNPEAKVTIVEFSDFECPFCGKYFQETAPQIMKDYVDTGKVRYVFRDSPLDFHQKAQKAAEAAECAGEQGKYWEMHDYLFQNQDYLAVENLKGYAKDLKLDTAKFNDCLDKGKMAEEVKKDLADAQKYGVSGTPAFFINGKLISGAQPYGTFKVEIEAALAAAKNTETVKAEEVKPAVVENKPAATEPKPAETKPTETIPALSTEAATDTKTVTEVKMIPLTAKKWMFGPNKIVVKKGDIIQLSIIPVGIEFTFALPGYNIEKVINKATTFEFTANKVGNFEFKCKSCEDWRGMSGTLIVE